MGTEQQLFEELDRRWSDLVAALDGISDEDLLEPGMTGYWSGKDTLAHITRWDAYVIGAVNALVGTGVGPDGGYRAVINRLLETNDIWAAEDVDRPLAEVKSDFHGNHAALMTTLRGLDPEQIQGEVKLWVEALIEHYPEHTPIILAWRTAQG